MSIVTSTTGTELALLGLAFLLSAVVGTERQLRSKSAGLRTHTLVGMGSALFTLVSAYGFESVTSPDAIVDPTRIAAQIVSGIGFLGAGVIFVNRGSVSGLTTAASIWVTAAIGMACGAGQPVLAVAGTGFHLLTVVLLTLVGRRMVRRRRPPTLVVRYRNGEGVLRDILATATELGFEASLLSVREVPNPRTAPRIDATLRFSGASKNVEDLVFRLAELHGVLRVTRTQPSDER